MPINSVIAYYILKAVSANKQLKALLAKGDTKGAIAHFDEIPSSLKNDLELKNLLGALYFSDSQYENAIAIAEEILAIEPENMDKKMPLYCHLTKRSNFVKNARNEVNFTFSEDFVKGIKWANQIGADFVIFEKNGKLVQKNLKTGEQTEIE